MSDEFYYPLEITNMEYSNNATNLREIVQEISTENNNQNNKAVPKNFQLMEKMANRTRQNSKLRK